MYLDFNFRTHRCRLNLALPKSYRISWLIDLSVIAFIYSLAYTQFIESWIALTQLSAMFGSV